MADKKVEKVEFSPAIPIPLVFDVEGRIKELQGYLDPSNPDYQPEWQHENIRAVIKLYEEGKIDGIQRTTIINGKIASYEDAFTSKTGSWIEGVIYQRAQKFAYGHGLFGPNGHELKMFVRLIPGLGGDGTALGISVLNDTGSDALSIFNSDVLQLGAGIQAYGGQVGMVRIINANGAADTCMCMLVEIQLIKDDYSPWGDWIRKRAIIRPNQPGTSSLSGPGMRDVLYFGTAPGNHTIAVSTTKGGLSSLL
ncbi:hypothetical protein V492_01986 [Pseudogymnoascus sp. VKM F-4246]|nr:hypothetical protein V492_01986 [Pseudogymnoascus sp. VKM F-4246]